MIHYFRRNKVEMNCASYLFFWDKVMDLVILEILN